MANPHVIIVCLRRPVRSIPNEQRSDPFWEFGSFGCTGCHRKNLMHPARLDELAGCRLGFAQGGSLGVRLVYLTPPVEVVRGERANELRWSPPEMPFRYGAAPLLVANDGASDMPSLKKLIADAERRTWEGRFSSKFRSRRKPLPGLVAREVVRVYQSCRAAAGPDEVASRYQDALPHLPPRVDTDRAASYAGFTGAATTPPSGGMCRARRRRC